MDSDDDFDYIIYSQYEVVSNQTKDYYIKGHANSISCAVCLR